MNGNKKLKSSHAYRKGRWRGLLLLLLVIFIGKNGEESAGMVGVVKERRGMKVGYEGVREKYSSGGPQGRKTIGRHKTTTGERRGMNGTNKRGD